MSIRSEGIKDVGTNWIGDEEDDDDETKSIFCGGFDGDCYDSTDAWNDSDER
jgi:hypothetical protein